MNFLDFGPLRLRQMRDEGQRALRRERVFRERANPLRMYTDEDFRKRFRLTRMGAIRLVELLRNDLGHEDGRGRPVDPALQVLIALRYYATSSFQAVVGDLHGIHVATACRVIHRVSRLIASRRAEFIRFPSDENLHKAKQEFYAIAGFPGVCGAIDCTHIRIQSPSRYVAGAYVNRKGFYSINVQAICNASNEITNIVARWPGSTHDSRIFENSRIKESFANGEIDGILVGDSGYPCRTYLMTPVLNPTIAAERRFNTAQRRTRIVIERSFGILKRRFPCVQNTMRTKLQNSLVIIVAVAVLHNIALSWNEPLPESEDEEEEEEEEDVYPACVIPGASGQARRRALINHFFA